MLRQTLVQITNFKNKRNLKNLFLLLIALFFANIVKAQPGWRDFTKRYYYTILDVNGKEISFKNNKNYSIMINDVLYKAPNIPQDSLKPAIMNSGDFENQIRINDLTLALPILSFNEKQKQLEIKIVHKKDTMYICQASGEGSFWGKYSKPLGLKPDFTLQFLSGHYFFPKWSKNLLDNAPQTNGLVHIQNLKQSNFIIPKSAYDSVCYISPIYDNRQKHFEKAEKLVVKNFMAGNFSFERSVQTTTFDKSIHPFKLGWNSWRIPYFTTKEKDEYIGILELKYDTLNWSGGRAIIAKYNFNENKMKLWSPTENLMYSSSGHLYKDSFNNDYYNRSIIRDSDCKELIYKCDFVTKLYRSNDEGETWKEDSKLTQLFNKYEIRELEFLDQHHALIFKLDKIRPKDKKYDIQQGTYYLLKDFRIIDSLKTPKDIHYNDNNNRYRFNIENDTIFLGNWSYDKYYSNGKTEYSQPILTKNNNKWKFQVVNKMYFINHSKPLLEMVSYQKFEIVGGTLYLNRHNGSLVSNQNNFIELHKQGRILENGNQIYLIGLEIGTLFSFDGGYNWFVYPLPLEEDSDYKFLKIDENGIISHFKSSWSSGEGTLNKIFNKFTKTNE